MARIALILCVLGLSGTAYSQTRATVQDRFAEKAMSVYAHALFTSHVRNDFYDSWGGGLDAGFYVTESIAPEIRLILLSTSLGDEARALQETTGLTPDARPQQGMVGAGIRWSLGYGKFQLLEDWVVHFDPQVTAHGGMAIAETRILPTGWLAFSFLTHWRFGIQAKLDLNLTIQAEDRDRGRVMSLGFMPVIGVGWSFGGLQ